ncbi:KH domain protein [Necator americanus]|uniref:KH domain protein n=1 Tax=Necator americanus TaxID=51031 RepID=W2T771_NECAM|nr:KH domain protein [Necator americanus]ETN77855.1 KH domain protein [Necator americanus]
MPQITKHLCAEPHVVGSIIGKDGTNLRRLQRNFKVNVEIDNNTGNSLRKISITGTEEAVSQAEARIMQLMSRGRQNSLNAANVDELPFEEHDLVHQNSSSTSLPYQEGKDPCFIGLGL